MQIELTAEQHAFIRRAVESGRFALSEAAVHDALALWIERERCRDELLALIDEAEDSLAADGGIVPTPESTRELVEEVHQRGLARLAARKEA